jgi:hypothetical protein
VNLWFSVGWIVREVSFEKREDEREYFLLPNPIREVRFPRPMRTAGDLREQINRELYDL